MIRARMKPCPFCGSNNIHVVKERYWLHVGCGTCASHFSISNEAKWNWRGEPKPNYQLSLFDVPLEMNVTFSEFTPGSCPHEVYRDTETNNSYCQLWLNWTSCIEEGCCTYKEKRGKEILNMTREEG